MTSYSLPEGYSQSSKDGQTLIVRNEWREVLESADWQNLETFPPLSTDMGRAPVRVIRVSDKMAFVARQFVHGGLLGAILGPRYIDPRRFLDELKNSDVLIQKGVRTPRVAALRIEKRGLFHTAWILTQEIGEATTLLSALAKSESLKTLLEKVAKELASMQDAGVWHSDFHHGNLLVKDGNIWIIDLDKSLCYQVLGSSHRIRNILRFARSLEKALFFKKTTQEGLPALWLDAALTHQPSTLHFPLKRAWAGWRARLPLRRLSWRLFG